MNINHKLISTKLTFYTPALQLKIYVIRCVSTNYNVLN